MTREQLAEIQQQVWSWLEDGYSIREISARLNTGRETVYRYANNQKNNYLDSRELSQEDKNITPRDVTRMALAGKVALAVMLGHSEKKIALAIGYSQPYVNRLKKLREVWGRTGIRIELTSIVHNADGEPVPQGIYDVNMMNEYHVWLNSVDSGICFTVPVEQIRGRHTLLNIHLTDISMENRAA